MRLSSKILIGVGMTAAIVALAGAMLMYVLITKSFPQTDGVVSVAGLSSEVHIYRDQYGVPHIVAPSEEEAYFAVGFVHAQDRLWQMELIRRAGMGRLAEILGEPALKIDRMFRTLGLWKHAHTLSAQLDAHNRELLERYAAGVNTVIESHKGKYPMEFDVLNITPDLWQVEHSILISRLMGWELNYARWVDVLLAELVERFGETKAAEVFPSWDEDSPLIIPDRLRGRRIATALETWTRTSVTMNPYAEMVRQRRTGRGNMEEGFSSTSLKPLLEADAAYRSLLGVPGFSGGSNAWVVSGSKSVTGKPMLANDPHLILTSPARWYELHVLAPGLDVAGASLAGVPFVVIGRNRSIAWGVTNAMVDDEDFYVEEVDSLEHPTRYRFNNGWHPIRREVDTILVKGGEPVFLTTYRTHRGPIVNRFEPNAQFARSLISMRWTGHEVSNEANAFYLINKAGNWKEFREALRHFALPAQNFVYADVEGNIGYRTGGLLPLRRTKGPTLPSPGSTDEYDWKGFVPFERMPELLNPPENFIATANNKIISDAYPYHISHHWEPPWRAERINELLRSQEKFSVEDFQRMQADVKSPHAKEIVPLILQAYEKKDSVTTGTAEALTYLRNWDYRMRQEDVATSVFQSFFLHVVRNTFRDEMGERLAALYDTLASIPLTVTTRLLKKGTSSWFDNVNTPQRETRDDIIRQSLEGALSDLKSLLGGELKEWRWGRLHKVEFGHVFGDVAVLRSIFNVGPFQTPGSHSTVWKGDFQLARPFVNHVGPSTRQIFDLADPNNTRAVTPPGQSGQVYHRHYKDQITLWLEGAYRQVPMDRELFEGRAKHHLVLRPAR